MAWRNSGPFLFGEIKHPEISGTTVGQSVLMRDASSAVQAARGSWIHGVSGIHVLTDSLSCTWIDRVIHGVTGLPNCFPILRVVSTPITLSTCAAKSNYNSSSFGTNIYFLPLRRHLSRWWFSVSFLFGGICYFVSWRVSWRHRILHWSTGCGRTKFISDGIVNHQCPLIYGFFSDALCHLVI